MKEVLLQRLPFYFAAETDYLGIREYTVRHRYS